MYRKYVLGTISSFSYNLFVLRMSLPLNPAPVANLNSYRHQEMDAEKSHLITQANQQHDPALQALVALAIEIVVFFEAQKTPR